MKIPSAIETRRPWRLWFLATAFLAAAVGCQTESSPGHDHDHDHEDEAHAEHVIPAHKPKDLPGAVRSLRALNDGFRADQIGGAKPSGDRPSPPIAVDVAGWLPEIAADSDLPADLWDKVDAASKVLVNAYAILAGQAKGDPKAAVNEADGQIKALESLVASSKPEWFEPAFKPRPPEEAEKPATEP